MCGRIGEMENREPESEDDELTMAIDDAIRDGDLPGVRRLLTNHPELTHRGHAGHPWLQTSAFSGNIEMAELLLSLGCDVNAEEEFATRLTALDDALSSVPMVRFLLRHGANPNQGRQVITAIAV